MQSQRRKRHLNHRKTQKRQFGGADIVLEKHQTDVIRYLTCDAESQPGMFLNFAPGTGKTFTALALLKNTKKDSFVICPDHLIESWKEQISIYTELEFQRENRNQGFSATNHKFSDVIKISTGIFAQNRILNKYIQTFINLCKSYNGLSFLLSNYINEINKINEYETKHNKLLFVSLKYPTFVYKSSDDTDQTLKIITYEQFYQSLLIKKQIELYRNQNNKSRSENSGSQISAPFSFDKNSIKPFISELEEKINEIYGHIQRINEQIKSLYDNIDAFLTAILKQLKDEDDSKCSDIITDSKIYIHITEISNLIDIYIEIFKYIDSCMELFIILELCQNYETFKTSLNDKIIIFDESQYLMQFFYEPSSDKFDISMPKIFQPTIQHQIKQTQIIQHLCELFSTTYKNILMSATPIYGSQSDIRFALNIIARKELVPYDVNTFISKCATKFYIQEFIQKYNQFFRNGLYLAQVFSIFLDLIRLILPLQGQAEQFISTTIKLLRVNPILIVVENIKNPFLRIITGIVIGFFTQQVFKHISLLTNLNEFFKIDLDKMQKYIINANNNTKKSDSSTEQNNGLKQYVAIFTETMKHDETNPMKGKFPIVTVQNKYYQYTNTQFVQYFKYINSRFFNIDSIEIFFANMIDYSTKLSISSLNNLNDLRVIEDEVLSLTPEQINVELKNLYEDIFDNIIYYFFTSEFLKDFQEQDPIKSKDKARKLIIHILKILNNNTDVTDTDVTDGSKLNKAIFKNTQYYKLFDDYKNAVEQKSDDEHQKSLEINKFLTNIENTILENINNTLNTLIGHKNSGQSSSAICIYSGFNDEKAQHFTNYDMILSYFVYLDQNNVEKHIDNTLDYFFGVKDGTDCNSKILNSLSKINQDIKTELRTFIYNNKNIRHLSVENNLDPNSVHQIYEYTQIPVNSINKILQCLITFGEKIIQEFDLDEPDDTPKKSSQIAFTRRLTSQLKQTGGKYTHKRIYKKIKKIQTQKPNFGGSSPQKPKTFLHWARNATNQAMKNVKNTISPPSIIKIIREHHTQITNKIIENINTIKSFHRFRKGKEIHNEIAAGDFSNANPDFYLINGGELMIQKINEFARKLDLKNYINLGRIFGNIIDTDINSENKQKVGIRESASTGADTDLIWDKALLLESTNIFSFFKTDPIENYKYVGILEEIRKINVPINSDNTTRKKSVVIYSNFNSEHGIKYFIDFFNRYKNQNVVRTDNPTKEGIKIQDTLVEICSSLDSPVDFSSLDADAKNKTLEDFENGKIDILCIDKNSSTGINIKGALQMHILEPFTSTTDRIQVIGRVSRMNSHQKLNEPYKKVDVFIWVASLSFSRILYKNFKTAFNIHKIIGETTFVVRTILGKNIPVMSDLPMLNYIKNASKTLRNKLGNSNAYLLKLLSQYTFAQKTVADSAEYESTADELAIGQQQMIDKLNSVFDEFTKYNINRIERHGANECKIWEK